MNQKKVRIEVFRLRLHSGDSTQSAQTGLFVPTEGKDRQDLLVSCISHPFLPTAKNSWQIGEIRQVSRRQIFFEFGKTTPDTQEYYDPKAHKYAQSPGSKTAHTFVYMDAEHQLVGIQPNFNLAPQAATIANNLGIAMTSKLAKWGATVTLGPVRDPAKFEQQLIDAYAVNSFSIAYTLPNDNLATDDIYKFLTGMAKTSGSEESIITTKSKDDIKNRDKLAQFARNANTGGFSANAKIRPEKDAGVKGISLGKSGGIVWVTAEEKDKGISVFQKMRSFLERVKWHSPDLPQDREENSPENQDQE